MKIISDNKKNSSIYSLVIKDTVILLFLVSCLYHVNAQNPEKIKFVSNKPNAVYYNSTINKDIEYERVAIYEDGTAMDDSKIDGVIYKKNDNKYYKRIYSGSIKSSWFGAVGDGLHDDTKAIQKAVTFCIENHKDLEIDGKYLITSSIIINRKVDSPIYDHFFVIFSNSGGGFVTGKAIPLFTTNYEFTGVPNTQLVNFKDISFRNLTSTNAAYVLDGAKFLRTQFNSCSFNGIRLLNATTYIQSIYLFNCNMRGWTGYFLRSTVRTYDFKMTGCLAEAAKGTCLFINEPFGCSIQSSCIEGMIGGSAMTFSRAHGINISGNYFEGNTEADINMSLGTGISYGIAIVGNFFTNQNTTSGNVYSILWGEAKGAISHGNYSHSYLHRLITGTDVDIRDAAQFGITNQ